MKIWENPTKSGMKVLNRSSRREYEYTVQFSIALRENSNQFHAKVKTM